MCLVSCLVPYLLCQYMGMCLCGVSGWVYQVSSVLQYIAVSLQSVGMRVSSVKCLMSCPIICVLSCPIVCVVSIQMCLCWGSSVKSLLSVGVECIKCQVSSLLSHNMFLLCHCTTGMCLCGVSGWEWWVSGVMSQHTDTLVTAPRLTEPHCQWSPHIRPVPRSPYTLTHNITLEFSNIYIHVVHQFHHNIPVPSFFCNSVIAY